MIRLRLPLYTVRMSSISLTIKQQWAGCLVVHPWSRAQIGVRRKGGGLRYVPFGGLLHKSWLPLWVTPVALAVTDWNYSDAHRSDQRHIMSGFVVGALIEQRAFVVLYDGRPKEV